MADQNGTLSATAHFTATAAQNDTSRRSRVAREGVALLRAGPCHPWGCMVVSGAGGPAGLSWLAGGGSEHLLASSSLQGLLGVPRLCFGQVVDATPECAGAGR